MGIWDKITQPVWREKIKLLVGQLTFTQFEIIFLYLVYLPVGYCSEESSNCMPMILHLLFQLLHINTAVSGLENGIENTILILPVLLILSFQLVNKRIRDANQQIYWIKRDMFLFGLILRKYLTTCCIILSPFILHSWLRQQVDFLRGNASENNYSCSWDRWRLTAGAYLYRFCLINEMFE